MDTTRIATSLLRKNRKSSNINPHSFYLFLCLLFADQIKLYGFQMQRGCFVNEHLNRYTKFLTDLVNVNVETSEEDKAVILLNYLPRKEYETFTLTFLNERKSLNYSEVSAALVSYEARRQDRLSSSGSTTAEALAVRGRSSNRKGRDDWERSKSRSGFKNLKKNQCALCKN